MSAAGLNVWKDLIAAELRKRGWTGGGDELKGRCVEPDHEDRNPSATWSVSRGCGRCHGCGARWSCRDMAQRLGVDLPPVKRAWPIRDATGRQFLHRRTDSAIGKEIRWEPSGAKPAGMLYRGDLLPTGTDSWAILVEGEPAADAVAAVGLQAVATVCGAGATPTEAALEPLRGRRVLLWSDADEVGRQHMRRIAELLAGIATEVAVYDTDPELGENADAEQHLAERGEVTAEGLLADLLAEAERVAVVGESSSAVSVPVSEFLAATYKTTEELIPGLLAVGAHTLIHAPRGLGKSHLVYALGVSLAAGRSTLPGFDVTRRTRALLIDGEMTPGLVQSRLRTHLDSTDGAGVDGYLNVVSKIGLLVDRGLRLPSLATPEGRAWLLQELDAFPAEVIFVDTCRALMRHPDFGLNDEEGWRPVEELLAELSARGVALCYSHHDGKGGDQLGTSAREFDPSYVVHLERPKRRGGFLRFVMSETKGRLGPSFTPRELVFEPGSAGEGGVWSVVDGEEKTKADLILHYSASRKGATPLEIAEACRTTPAHVRSVLSKARRSA